MIKSRTIVFLALLLPAIYSCKTKKIAAKPTEKVETESGDKEIFNIQRELPADQVERTDAGIRFTFSSEILFPTNSSYLNEKSKSRIDDVAKVIKNKYADKKLLVEGHSDKTGTSEYNLWLSEKRANSVKTYLVGLGIPAENIKISGLGDSRPIADNTTKEGRLINRRVEVTVLKAD